MTLGTLVPGVPRGRSILAVGMPIYEYRCQQGHTFEVTQRMSDDPVTVCETCESPVQRVFHPIAVHFKGSGFYNTDYGTRKRARELKDSAEGPSKRHDKKDSSSSSSNSNSDSSSSGSSSSGSSSSSASESRASSKNSASKSSSD
ncbi:MAG: FmdB family zinc ribbon protein [Solirubrobacteraceae bacterium]